MPAWTSSSPPTAPPPDFGGSLKRHGVALCVGRSPDPHLGAHARELTAISLRDHRSTTGPADRPQEPRVVRLRCGVHLEAFVSSIRLGETARPSCVRTAGTRPPPTSDARSPLPRAPSSASTPRAGWSPSPTCREVAARRSSMTDAACVAELLFSEADATPMSTDEATIKSWDDARACVESAAKGWLTTVRPDGRPHAVPVLLVWSAGAPGLATRPTSRRRRTSLATLAASSPSPATHSISSSRATQRAWRATTVRRSSLPSG